MIKMAVVLLLLTRLQSQPWRDGMIVQDREYGYTLRLPEGWVRVSREQVDGVLDAALTLEGRSSAATLAVFQPSRSQQWDLPYVQVYFLPVPGGGTLDHGTMEQMAAGIREAASKGVSNVGSRVLTESARQGVSAPVLQPPEFDLENRTYTLNSSGHVEGMGEVICVARGRFCRRGVIHVACFCRRAEYDQYRSILAGMLDRFEASPFEMKESGGVAPKYDAFIRQNESTQIKLAVLIVLGGLVYAYVKSRRSSRRGQSMPPDPNVQQCGRTLDSEETQGRDTIES